MKTKIVAIAMCVCNFGAIYAAASYEQGCNPAQQAAVQNVVDWVKADLLAGMTEPQILADVSQRLGGAVGLDVEALVMEAIALLTELHVLPAPAQTSADTMFADLSSKVAMKRAALHAGATTITKTDGGK